MPKPPNNNRCRAAQSGNIFIFILIGVVLFAALSYTIARSMRSETTGRMSAQKAKLAAADIMSYAQKIERAIDKLRRKGVSENDISFANATVAGYNHTPAQPDANKVFHPQGGGASWRNPPENANDGSLWLFTGESCIVDVGTGGAGCDSNSTADEELLLVLPNLQQAVCEEINSSLKITGIPLNAGTGYSTVKFTGTFQDGTVPDNMNRLKAGCFDGGGAQSGYHFYYVLIAR